MQQASPTTNSGNWFTPPSATDQVGWSVMLDLSPTFAPADVGKDRPCNPSICGDEMIQGCVLLPPPVSQPGMKEAVYFSSSVPTMEAGVFPADG